jgi:hypothetical protein
LETPDTFERRYRTVLAEFEYASVSSDRSTLQKLVECRYAETTDTGDLGYIRHDPERAY